MADFAKLDLLLNQIEENCSPSEYEQAFLPFMFECADLIAHLMPKVARDSLAIAKDYVSNTHDAARVKEAVQRCWTALDSDQGKRQLEDPGVSSIRLVICILHKQLHPELDDFLDMASFFLRLINNVEPSYDQLATLIRKWFGKCLSD
jgi:hypothetical protein